VTNPHTGKKEQTPPATDAYRDNWDKIFGKKSIFSGEVMRVIGHDQFGVSVVETYPCRDPRLEK